MRVVQPLLDVNVRDAWEWDIPLDAPASQLPSQVEVDRVRAAVLGAFACSSSEIVETRIISSTAWSFEVRAVVGSAPFNVVKNLPLTMLPLQRSEDNETLVMFCTSICGISVVVWARFPERHPFPKVLRAHWESMGDKRKAHPAVRARVSRLIAKETL